MSLGLVMEEFFYAEDLFGLKKAVHFMYTIIMHYVAFAIAQC